MSFAGRAASSSGFAIGPRVREIGLTGFAAPIQRSSPIGAMSWQRPNIGSRVNREVHARFWERAEVKFLRATRQTLHIRDVCVMSACAPTPDISLRHDQPSRGVRRLLFKERASALKLQQVRHVLP